MLAGVLFAVPTRAATIDRVSGWILLQVESHGEAWYVDPVAKTRSYLGLPSDAFALMRSKALGVTNANLEKIPDSTSSAAGDMALRQRLSGRILLQVEGKGEAWYVWPKDLRRYYLGLPSDAFNIMRGLGLGITNTNLAQIPSAGWPTNKYETRSLATARGTFSIHLLTVDLANSVLELVTDAGNATNCTSNCPAQELLGYIRENNGFAGIHGTYFCPPDYAQCAGEKNSYLFPVYNSALGRFVNEERLPYTTAPLLVFDTNNTPYFFYRTKDFWSVEQFETTYKTKIRAAISNNPALIFNKQNVVNAEPLDDKQRNTKGNRGGIGVKGTNVYLVIATSATVPDLAAIFESLGVDHAMNLDGGGSSAMYFNGAYKVGPGRLLPNAIVIKEKGV